MCIGTAPGTCSITWRSAAVTSGGCKTSSRPWDCPHWAAPSRLEEAIDHIAELRKGAIRSKRQGNFDRARRLWAEADELEQDVERRLMSDQRRDGRRHRDDRRRRAHLRDRREGQRGPREDVLEARWREVEALRREVEELKQLLREALKRRNL